MKRRALLVVSILGIAAISEGCGYRLAGGNMFLPERIRVIMVSPFENRTTRPEIEQRVTEEAARELTKRGRYRVVTHRAEADALLEGAVTDFRTSPVQFNEQGRATRVETVVTLQATLRDLSSEAVLWNQSGLIFRSQYAIQPSAGNLALGSAADLSGKGFFDQETLALDEIARGAASALVTSILEGF